MKEKKELVRIVKAPDLKDENGEVIQAGEISVDFIGKSLVEVHIFAAATPALPPRKSKTA